MRSKYRDPLHVLLEYIASVSVMFHNVTALISYMPWTMQQAPHCDMALVHDDDLERILLVGDGTVSDDHAFASLLIASCP